ncbi:receptor-type tyrosine-protein phosphatase zeta isoform X6 [Phyllopteryx taeniolatus]|uniref:receptor-type tyrosine-protein phosphatase zeta isoform X6 n=1 Tax=Phyllopteryx taeniolatus TaxID=161469 RepID=UPI002AD54594|nr:receptor-type tyrosine-protein phosphatase zeta isoform X6 [Phyllopteryx taeniolatus]
MDASRAALLHILLTLQQVGGYTYRNQRKFTEDIDWSYAGTLNQNNWAKKFPSCSNAKQSPIDVEENLAQVKLQYQNLRLDGWENLTGRRTTIKNDGKTVALDVDGDFYVSGGGLGSKFKAGRITFHWGRCNASSEGSEHSLDGVKYPLEMQIYCYQPQRFESFDQTVKAGGPITALAVLFEVSSEDDNANFAPIVDAINGVSRYGKRGQVAPFSPRALLPNSTDKYFIYNGSLTTPPCSETVEWIVFKNTVYISADQLEVFCEVMTMEQAGYVMLMDYLQNNYREQQRKFMGQVFSSYTGTEELLTPVCSSEPENLEATSYNRSSLLVTWERPRAVYDSAIEKYSVSYKMADAEDAAPSEYLTDGDQDVGAILDDLVANSSYVVQVVAVCANGLYGRVSDPMTFAVPPDGPENSLIPDSNEFDYEEANYPPETFSNESVQKEDYDQAWIPTKSPATSTSGPPRRRPQNGIGATKTQSTTVAEVTTRFPSTTPLYANTSDHSGGVGPKSSESIKVDLTATTPTGSNVWMKGGKGVPSGGTTTTSTTNKTMTRPMTMTVNQTMTTNKAVNRTTTMATNTIANKTMTRPLTKTTTMNMTTAMTPNTTANKTTNMTKTVETTTYTTPEKSRTLPMDKTATVTRPTNKITTMNTTTAMTADPTANKNMTTNVTMTPPMHKTTSVTRTTVKTVNKTRTMNMTTAVATNTTANKNTTMTSPINKTTTRPLNTTTIMIRPATTTLNKTETATRTKNMTTNLIHLRDHIITPSSVLIDPYAGLTTPETDDASGVHDDDVVRVQGEPPPESPPRGPITPSMPHFSATKTSVWQNGVLLQTTPPLSKAATSEPASAPSLPSVPVTPSSADHSNGVSGSDVDQERDGVRVSASGENTLPLSTEPPSTTLESGQTPEDSGDRSSAFYFDSESGSAAGSGRAGTAPPRGSAVPSPTPPEESGSGQAENLYDNDNSSDFSIPERTQRESEKEEYPVADVSDSSHESRVGTLRDGRRKAAVPLAVISALTALGLALLIGILLYWRMCFQTAHFYVDESASPRVAATPAFTSAVSLPVCLLDEKAALPVKDFVKHVAELHRTCGFQRKFEEVQASTADVAMTSETSDHPDNKSKNRYSNILAFDRSRVRLSAADKDGGGRAGDYINANFVDGFKMRHAYIAAQGPLKSSTDDFWRMIWEQNVGIVVMITNLLEKGRRKCDQYWPADVREDYGGLVVALKSVQKLAHYTQRTFTVTKAHVKKGSQRGRSLERVVTQYHYTQWPDMGVPEHALPLISFIRKSSRARTANMGPVVVHCSAGVGRTGTYLVLDSMLRQMRQEDAVDVDGFLRHVRTQRNYLVQTQEQYVFIHDALAEAVLCGDTEVAAPRLHAYVERLLTPRHDGNTPLDRQLKVERPSLRGSERLPRRFLSRSDPRHMFHIRKISNRNVAELLSAEAANADDYASALHDDNRHKNRSGSLLPVERSRVRLSPCAGDASDYINASYVTGYRQSKEFIITQNPLPGTVKDFWRMIWDQNARVIVSLSGPALAQDEDEDEEAGPCVFWPGKGQPIGWETLTVTQTCENLICLADEDPLLVHRLDVRAAQDDFVLDVRLYRAPCWPNPDSGTSDAFLLLELLRREEEKEEEEGEETSAEEGPVVVLDRAGGVTAGTFCALSSLIGQLHGQRRVDVFRAARMTNLSRPGTFRTRDQLAFLYEALLGVLDKQQRQEEEDGEEDGEDGEEEPPRSAADSLQSLV